jgi:peptidoglycan/LPS O-acetylase OafA/YrhL
MPQFPVGQDKMNQGVATVADVTSRQSGSLLSIQVLRALAALAVVMPHITREFELKFGLTEVLPLDAFRLGNVGVDVFFVISGFIMVHVSELVRPTRRPAVFLLASLRSHRPALLGGIHIAARLCVVAIERSAIGKPVN